MPIYGNFDIALAGMKAEDNQGDFKIDSYIAKEQISFGDGIYGYVGDTNKPQACWKYHQDTAKVVYSADFVASNSIAFSVNGVAITPVVFATNQLTTITALKNAVGALSVPDINGNNVAVNCILDATDTNNRTLLVRAVGSNIVITSTVTGGVSQPTATITYSSDQVFLGVAMKQEKYKLTYADCYYYINDVISCVSNGEVWAFSDTTAKFGIEAKVKTSSVLGTFVSSGDSVGCMFTENYYTNTTTGDTIAVVKVNGMKKINAVIAW